MTLTSVTGPGLPLSVGQRALLFVHGLAGQPGVHNVALAVRVGLAISPAVLADAVADVLAQHELLRSVYVEVDGEARRYVLPVDGAGCRAEFEVHDLPGASQDTVKALAHERTMVPFRLDAQPPLRVMLIRVAGDDSVLVAVTHHIATDGDSQTLILQDLLTAYAARVNGTSPAWRPPSANFTDLVAEETAMLGSAEAEAHARYWSQVCRDAPDFLALPTDRPRPERQGFTGAQCDFRLSEELVTRLRTAATKTGVTSFALLMAAFQVLLQRTSGQRDFMVGYPATTRNSRHTRGAIGYLVNTLPLRAQLDPADRFAELAERVGARVREGFRHRGYPFALIRRDLGLAPDLSRPPIFQVLFTMVVAYPPRSFFEVSVGGEGSYLGAPMRGFDVAQQAGQYDITLDLAESRTGIRGIVKYDTALFLPDTARRIADQFVTVVEAITNDPGRRIRDIPMVNNAERDFLLALGNQSIRAEPAS